MSESFQKITVIIEDGVDRNTYTFFKCRDVSFETHPDRLDILTSDPNGSVALVTGSKVDLNFKTVRDDVTGIEATMESERLIKEA